MIQPMVPIDSKPQNLRKPPDHRDAPIEQQHCEEADHDGKGRTGCDDPTDLQRSRPRDVQRSLVVRVYRVKFRPVVSGVSRQARCSPWQSKAER